MKLLPIAKVAAAFVVSLLSVPGMGCGRERKSGRAFVAAQCSEWENVTNRGCAALSPRLITPANGIGTGAVRDYAATLDGSGKLVAAWAGGDTGTNPSLEIADERTEGIFVQPASLALPEGFNWSAAIASGHRDEVTVVWQHQTQRTASVMQSTRNSAGVWTHPIQLSERVSLEDVWAGSPKISCTTLGRCLSIWTQAGTAPGSKLVHRDQFQGLAVAERERLSAEWKKPAGREDVVSPRLFFVDGNQVALREDGSALLAWYQAGSTPKTRKQVLAAYKAERRSPEDPFPRIDRNETLSPTTHDISGNRSGVAVLPLLGPDGRAAIVWTQETRRVPNGEVRTIMLAVKQPNGFWETPEHIGEGLVPAGTDAFAVVGAFASDGSLLLAWQEGDFSPDRAIRSLWLPAGQRVKTTEPTIVSTPNAEAIQPSLAYVPRKGFALTWVEKTNDGPFRPTLRYRKPGGDQAWSRPLLLSTSVSALDCIDIGVHMGGPSERVVVTWKSGVLGKEKLVAVALE
jgi:hypothetical protein